MYCFRNKLFILIMGFVTILSIGGCSSMRPHAQPSVRIEGSPSQFTEGQIVDTKSARAISFDELIENLGSKNLVFVGEVHDNPEHHLIQVQILQALIERHGPLDIAAEYFEKPQQNFIDRYLKGEIEEKAFLSLTGWERKWSFDYSFYRPLILAVKHSGNRIYAINAPGTIVKKVARTGLESISIDERSQIAEHIDLGNRKHRKYIREAYKFHRHSDLKKFDFFYQAQCVWEETMAESIASRIKKTGKKMVVFSGNGHIIQKFGIPERAFKRTGEPFATLVLYPSVSHEAINRDMADYIWITGQYSARKHFMRR
jgi:uncharacterized iron-regulated protein